MSYNISLKAEKVFLFLFKKMIHCGDRDEAVIPEPVGDENEI
jgi:hypothetical protein